MAKSDMRWWKFHRCDFPSSNCSRCLNRLLSRFSIGDGCWDWTGSISSHGYGRFSIRRLIVGAHRFVYELIRGKIPDGLSIDHLCRNRRCVNPDHMEPVTIAENTLRGESPCARFKRRDHCIRGHPFEGNTRMRDGWRVCKVCANILAKERYHRLKRIAKC